MCAPSSQGLRLAGDAMKVVVDFIENVAGDPQEALDELVAKILEKTSAFRRKRSPPPPRLTPQQPAIAATLGRFEPIPPLRSRFQGRRSCPFERAGVLGGRPRSSRPWY